MTQMQFILECQHRSIEPSIALEDDAIVEALQSRDDDAVIEALNNNF